MQYDGTLDSYLRLQKIVQDNSVPSCPTIPLPCPNKSLPNVVSMCSE